MRAFYKKITPFVLLSFCWLSFTAASKAPDPIKQVKDYLNDSVEAVHKADTAAEKVSILNRTFDNYILAASNALKDDNLPEEVIGSLEYIKIHFEELQSQLLGTNGLEAVPDDQLDAFATFAQQNTETAFSDLSGPELLWAILGIALIVLIAVALIDCHQKEQRGEVC